MSIFNFKPDILISKKSALTFIYINSFLFTLAYLQSELFFFSFLLRNYCIVWFINYGTRNKEHISQIQRKKNFVNDHFHVFLNTLIESLTKKTLPLGECPWKYFLLGLFLFEFVLDFFHYCFHRLMHTPTFYRFHKKHHSNQNPTTINTFCHNPIDVFLTVSIPTMLSFYVNPWKFTPFQLNLILVYKMFIEVSGHSGKKVKPSSSFPLCVWLPRFFKIELYTEDHHRHHAETNCNYSKRFKFWDWLFGTYSS